MLEIDYEKSLGLFEDNVDKVLVFLEKHNIKSKPYLEFLSKNHGGYAKENTIMIGDEEYSLEMMFGQSRETIYDLEKNNSLMKIDNSKFVAIGNLFGDDLVGLMPSSDKVYFCSLDDTECESLVEICESFDSFMKMIK